MPRPPHSPALDFTRTYGSPYAFLLSEPRARPAGKPCSSLFPSFLLASNRPRSYPDAFALSCCDSEAIRAFRCFLHCLEPTRHRPCCYRRTCDRLRCPVPRCCLSRIDDLDHGILQRISTPISCLPFSPFS